MDSSVIIEVFANIRSKMIENKDYLVELDQQSGDGDLGISMADGYNGVYEFMSDTEIEDLGMLFMKAASVFNSSAPSSLGTITSFGLMGMAQSLKGKKEANLREITDALEEGINKIMEKAKSKPGEKTILDSLCPGVESLKANKDKNIEEAFRLASIAAKEGAKNTINMRAVHGRAAYYGDKSIGLLDGGAVVGKLIFEGIYEYISGNK